MFLLHHVTECKYVSSAHPQSQYATKSITKEAWGNNYKLIQHHCHYDLRKLSFTNRVIPIWNSLPNHVVSADTIKAFKNHLDKFWSDQEMLYDYNTDLHGIGNCSLL